MASTRFRHPGTAVLMVDMQQKLVPHMFNADALTERVGVLLAGAGVIGLPVLVTEHYPQGLGSTLQELGAKLQPDTPTFSKMLFSALTDSVRERLVQLSARGVIVCGVEAHVCVLQTCLDLIDRGFQVAVAVDAIGSRRRSDNEVALKRLAQAGVVSTTTESALLELLGRADHPIFKSLLPLIK